MPIYNADISCYISIKVFHSYRCWWYHLKRTTCSIASRLFFVRNPLEIRQKGYLYMRMESGPAEVRPTACRCGRCGGGPAARGVRFRAAAPMRRSYGRSADGIRIRFADNEGEKQQYGRSRRGGRCGVASDARIRNMRPKLALGAVRDRHRGPAAGRAPFRGGQDAQGRRAHAARGRDYDPEVPCAAVCRRSLSGAASRLRGAAVRSRGGRYGG